LESKNSQPVARFELICLRAAICPDWQKEEDDLVGGAHAQGNGKVRASIAAGHEGKVFLRRLGSSSSETSLSKSRTALAELREARCRLEAGILKLEPKFPGKYKRIYTAGPSARNGEKRESVGRRGKDKSTSKTNGRTPTTKSYSAKRG